MSRRARASRPPTPPFSLARQTTLLCEPVGKRTKGQPKIIEFRVNSLKPVSPLHRAKSGKIGYFQTFEV